MALDLKRIKKKLEELDNGQEAGKGKLSQNLDTLYQLISQLQTAEESDEVLRTLALAYKLKKRTKIFLRSLWEEERQLRRQLEESEAKAKRLQRELRVQRERNKTLEEENADLKEQVDLLNAFREENNKNENGNIGSGSEESEDDDNQIDTFNAELSLDTQPDAGKKGATDDRTPPEEGRSRSESKITIHVEKIKPSTQKPTRTTDEEARGKQKARARARYDKGQVSASVSIPSVATSASTISGSQSVSVPNPSSLEKTRGTNSSDSLKNARKYTILNSEPTQKDEPAPAERKGNPPAAQAPIFDENTVVDIITGLEVTIRERNWADENPSLGPKDFTHWYQFKVKRKNRELLKFKDFAPKVFMQMRRHWGVSDEDYLRSFQYENLTAIKGEGKSGAFFIFTKDKQFLLKTATDAERDFLWATLPYYWQYMSRHPDSLLPRFYGVYSMKHEGIGGVIRFVVTNNLFNTPYEPVERYDLKGSTVGRFTSERKKKPGAILKDLDIKESNRALYLPKDLRKDLFKQIHKDCEFLAKHNVMDYSFLLGVYYETPDNREKTAQNLTRVAESKTVIEKLYKNKFQQYHNGLRVTRPDGTTEVYYFGIIDVLVQYVAKKKMEHFVKSIVNAGEQVSVIEPRYYSNRFEQFIKGIVAIPAGESESSSSSEQDMDQKETETNNDTLSPLPSIGRPSSAASSDSKERRSTSGTVSGKRPIR